MAEQTLRELLDDAMHKVDTYRSPNLDDFRAAINPVLAALNEGSIGEYDGVSSITETAKEVIINTEWMVRQCEQTSRLVIPAYIIDAVDPVKEATRYYLIQCVAGAKEIVIRREHQLHTAKAALEQAQSKLDEFLKAEVKANEN